MYTFRIPVTTNSKIIPEACKALYEVLKEDYLKFGHSCTYSESTSPTVNPTIEKPKLKMADSIQEWASVTMMGRDPEFPIHRIRLRTYATGQDVRIRYPAYMH
ncbi:hypothetical protein Hamer_G023205, partial [Homarus americanus]